MGEILLSEKQLRVELEEDIRFMLDGIPEQVRLMFFRSLGAYFKSLVTFGKKSETTRNSLLVFKDILKISKQEKELLNYILDNLDRFNARAVENVLDKLDKLNDKTFESYDRILSDIDEAWEMKDEKRFVKASAIDSLISNGTYNNMVYALSSNDTSIKNFLGFSDDFWKYIENNMKKVPAVVIDNADAYGVRPVVDRDGNLSDFITIVPTVVDYESAKIAIDTYSKAYIYYLNLGKKLDSIVMFGNNKEDLYFNTLKK